MAEIKVLIEGYAKEINGEEFASSSVTLIRDHNLNILVDVGMEKPADVFPILEALLEPFRTRLGCVQ